MRSTSVAVRPWERPFWKPSKGKGVIFFYLILFHVLAITGLVLFPLPSLPWEPRWSITVRFHTAR